MSIKDISYAYSLNENIPNFHLLGNKDVRKKLRKNHRLKNLDNNDRYMKFSEFSFHSPHFSGLYENNDRFYHQNKDFLVLTNFNDSNKTLKFLILEFLKKNLSKINLVKEISLNNTITCIENSGKNLTAIGTTSNEIQIWETNKILEDEPLMILKNRNCDIIEKFPISGKNSHLSIKPNNIFISSLKWNLNKNLLEGSSNGILNYWDMIEGKKLFSSILNSLPVSSLNWRNHSRNEILYLSGNYLSCFVDARCKGFIHKEVFEEEIKEIQWLNCEHLYVLVETSGLISMKDIRFQKKNIYTKSIYEKKTNKTIKYLQFSPHKKNLMIVDTKGTVENFCLNGSKIEKGKSLEIKNLSSTDYFWLEKENHESLVILDQNSKFTIFD